MLCKTAKITDKFSDEWLIEIKYDGERAIIEQNDSMIIRNRRGEDITFRYPELVENIELPKGIYDGEIVVEGGGKTIFNRLQKRLNLQNRNKIRRLSKLIPTKFICFDVIQFGDEDLRNKPLKERKKVLNQIKNNNYIETAKTYPIKEKEKVWNIVKNKELEGIVIKNINSKYENFRSNNWVKIKNIEEDDFIIVGYTSKTREISALILSDGKKITGKVNMAMSGFQYNIWKDRLEKIKTEKPNCAKDLKLENGEKLFFVEQKYIAVVRYLEKSDNGLRFPILKEIRVRI